MKITVVYNRVENLDLGKPEDVLADEDTVHTASEIISALKSEGFDVDSFEINESNAKQILTYPTDIFFNNGYGIGSISKSESDLASLLEESGKPYTGSDAKTLTLTLDKTCTKEVLIADNITTPKFQYFTNNETLDPTLQFPLIVKPNNEDCSLGLNENSVVENVETLQKQVELMQQTYPDPVLVEEYITGRELNITVLGNKDDLTVLPVSEIVFGDKFPGKYKIVDFTSKWKTDSLEYQETNGVCPADLSKDVLEKIENISRAAFNVTKCRDYARIDIRLADNGEPYVLEVNANPGIGPDDGATRSAKAAGFTYSQFLRRIVELAMSRYA